MAWIPMAIGAGLGLLKSGEDKANADKQRAQEAAIMRYSPWTGMQGHTVKNPSAIGDVMQGGIAGAIAGSTMGSGAAAPAAGDAVASEGASGAAPSLMTPAETDLSGTAGMNSAAPSMMSAPGALTMSKAAAPNLGNYGAQMGSAGALNGAGPGVMNGMKMSAWKNMQQMYPNMDINYFANTSNQPNS